MNNHFAQKDKASFTASKKIFVKQKRNLQSVVTLKSSKSLLLGGIKTKKPTTVKAFLQRESNLVGNTDSKPTESLERLKRQALLLEEADFSYLLKEVLNSQLEGDRRFLSVYLLSLSQNIKAKSYLEEIISTPIKKEKIAQHLYEQELVIKMKAVEGFLQIIKIDTAYKAKVENLLKQQEDPFLVQFIRSLM